MGVEKKIAEAVKTAGGRVYYVGGCVRDSLLGLPRKDVDIEVYGIDRRELLAILEKLGPVDSFGADFGIYGLAGTDLDIALPRREYALGSGHKSFEIQVDPYMDTAQAARRRDFTINAIMEDVLTGEIQDPYGGRADLSAGIIRHIDDKAFVEDPLRVFRAAQFAARFSLDIAPETAALCQTMDVSVLPKTRVEEELKKGLLKAEKPSLFFESLRKMNKLSPWFSEVESLIGVQQEPSFHPEGDVWTHTMQVIDRAAAYQDRVSDPYAFLLLALTHDFGKSSTTKVIHDVVHSYGHETEGLPLIESFLRRLTDDRKLIDYVVNMVPLHMKPNIAARAEAKLKSTNRLFDSAAAPGDLIFFALADKPAADSQKDKRAEFLFSRYEQYKELMEKPGVSGKDLIAAGIAPGDDFREILDYAHKLRLAGIDRDSALKQTVAYAKKKRKRAASL